MTALPKTKSARRERVGELIRSQQIHSQADLLRLVKKAGFDVTQATLSRDLDELGAIKVRDSEGFLVYALPTELRVVGDDHRVARLIEEFVLNVDRSGDLVIVRTPPGGAQLLASGLDQLVVQSDQAIIIGTVAGDDTILLVSREGQGQKVVAAIRSIAEGRGGPEQLMKRGARA